MLLGIKRIYEKASILDGKRVLVDGLWPRGVKRSTANIDEWAKGVAPSKELRLWFNHTPDRWDKFKERYTKELNGNKDLERLVEAIRTADVTLVYSSHDQKHNNAVVLAMVIKSRLKKSHST